jgi:hypothetical protein
MEVRKPHPFWTGWRRVVIIELREAEIDRLRALLDRQSDAFSKELARLLVDK